MPGPATASNDLARERLYLNSAKQGVVFARTFNFYSGSPTTPTSFTGNQVLGVSSDGPGANIINGIGPVLEQTIPCDAPTIFDVSVVNGDDNTFVTVEYNNPLPDDIYVLFSTSGGSYGPSAVSIVGDTVVLTFPADEDLVPGTYNLKILRAEDPAKCFAIRYNIVSSAAAVCEIEVTGWSGPGIFPNPPLTPGTNDVVVSVTGSGFLSGPLTVTIFAVFGGPTDLNIDSVVVIDDNNLDVQFDTDPFETGNYAVRVELTADPSCFGEYGTDFGEDMLSVDFA